MKSIGVLVFGKRCVVRWIFFILICIRGGLGFVCMFEFLGFVVV